VEPLRGYIHCASILFSFSCGLSLATSSSSPTMCLSPFTPSAVATRSQCVFVTCSLSKLRPPSDWTRHKVPLQSHQLADRVHPPRYAASARLRTTGARLRLGGSSRNVEPLVDAGVDGSRRQVLAFGDVELAGIDAVRAGGNRNVGPSSSISIRMLEYLLTQVN